MGVLGGDLVQAYADDLRDLVRSAVLRLHRQHDRGTQVGRDPGVHGQLARRCDVGVIAADDQHRITLVGHMVVPIHDVSQRRVWIFVQLLIADADTLVVGQARGGVRQQQFQDVVAVLTEPGNGTEDADLGDRGRQPVQDAERDGRLAGIALWRGDVDRGGHAANLSAESVSFRPEG